uniref:Uncharacterized protein n=1 Tax=Arundo donax TaxID=35708 RepID=A0A0A9AZE6_ARUDO
MTGSSPAGSRKKYKN